ncbi:MAG: transketolase [Magnetovibrio sp.]|nr:transketolase [Magnetovibrio sp.]
MIPNDKLKTDSITQKHCASASDLQNLADLERQVRWLSSWTIHHANYLRPNSGQIKVGGHQASCASAVTLMTALYFYTLRSYDRVAVKPHASPVFHAIQYLLGNQSLKNLEAFRAFNGAQSYPSRTKDEDDVDFSTGSVGLGPAMTLFTSMVQDYLRRHVKEKRNENPGRMIALVGDAEMDEGNIYEALWEGWKHGLRNCWWIIDYNRQSLDGVVTDHLFRLIDRLFRTTGWQVITIKYGKRMMEAFAKPGGQALRKWINKCPNDLYSALTFQGGSAWRDHLTTEIGNDPEAIKLIASYTDEALGKLMTNLGGHCLETVLDAFAAASQDDTPTCLIAYTVKGWGLPLQGHKDNHAGLMTPEQMQMFQQSLGIKTGEEWKPFAGIETRRPAIQTFLRRLPLNKSLSRRYKAKIIDVPDNLISPVSNKISTQEAFGRILYNIAGENSELASRIVTTSPDVTQSTNLGGWVNRRGIFAREEKADTFRAQQVPSMQKWAFTDAGQHMELGIAENNLFILLAALGLAHETFGYRLLPVGTVYDPFIARGLDALNYACYQDARFMLAGTPSGITLASEGGAHQSVVTPLIGLSQPGLAYFEPAFADELAEIMRWGFLHMQANTGGAIYLRLSTRVIQQPKRIIDESLITDVVSGGYWFHQPSNPKAGTVVYTGALATEAIAAQAKIKGLGVLAVTSADRLYKDWRRNGEGSHISALLSAIDRNAPIVTVLDGHPATLSWIGSVAGHKIKALGVENFGQCGDLDSLYEAYCIDTNAILSAYKN